MGEWINLGGDDGSRECSAISAGVGTCEGACRGVMGWKCPRTRAEKISPTPEKYPGSNGTHAAWTIEGYRYPDEALVVVS